MIDFSVPAARRRLWAAPLGRAPGAAALVLAVVSLLGAACAVGARESGPSSTRNLITRAELDELNADDVMEAVSILRPHWLRFRPMRTPGTPNPVVGVVVDGQPRGSRSDLAQIPIGTVERILFMTAADATIRFGTGFTGGAIVVTTRRSQGAAPVSPAAAGPIAASAAGPIAQAHPLE